MKLTKQMYSDWCYWDNFAEAFDPGKNTWMPWHRFTQPVRFVWYHLMGHHKDEWTDPIGTIHHKDDDPRDRYE